MTHKNSAYFIRIHRAAEILASELHDFLDADVKTRSFSALARLLEDYDKVSQGEEGRCPHGMFTSGAGGCPECAS